MLLQNRYQIVAEIAQGGFGKTYLAIDTHTPSQRQCVVKQLIPVNHDTKLYQLIQERFQKEAVTLEKLGESHSQIPRLYAYFESDGQFYLVQEYIEGKTLAAKVQQVGALSESTVRQILKGILPVIASIHQQQIVHRDIKPENIICRDSDEQPVLIDFGAVKDAVRSILNSQVGTNSSIAIGTPGFMPQEQAIGRPVFATDLYSLGLTAIFLLTGRYPQTLPIDPATGKTIWHEAAASVSPQLKAILDRAIEQHWQDRYASAQEMLAKLNPQQPVSYSATVFNSAPQPVVNRYAGTVETVPVRSVPPSMNDWQKAAIAGGTMGGFLLAGFGMAKLIDQPAPSLIPVAASPTSSVSIAPIASSTPEVDRPPEVQPSEAPVSSSAKAYPTQSALYSSPSDRQSPPSYTPNTCSYTAASDSTSYRVVNVASNDVLYVRSCPGNLRTQEGQIPPYGRNIQILGRAVSVKRARWVPIRYGNVRGWVNQRYLQDSSQTAATVRSIPAPLYRVVNVAANDVLYIRSLPGARTPEIGSIPAYGTNIRITSRGVRVKSSRWVKIEYQGTRGWVNSKFLAPQF